MLIKGLAKKGKLYLTLFIALALAVAAVYFYLASASSTPYSQFATAAGTTINSVQLANTCARGDAL